MRITLEMKDFWMDGDDLDAEIKKYIIRQVSSTVWEQIKDKANVEVKAVSEKKIEEALSKRITEHMLAAKIMVNGKSVALEEHIDAMIIRLTSDSYRMKELEARVHDKMKKMTEELMARYDLKFAATIVNKLKEKKMLNETAMIQLLA